MYFFILIAWSDLLQQSVRVKGDKVLSPQKNIFLNSYCHCMSTVHTRCC